MLRSHAILAAVLLSGLAIQVHAANSAGIPDTLRQQAAAGDAKAQVALGHALQDDGVEGDKSASADWYRKAAAQGNAEGAWLLGSMYMAGVGIDRDTAMAIDWMRKSVMLDHDPDHMASLAFAMLVGGDKQGAMQWARQAADKGSVKGMELLAMSYGFGQMGLSKDPAAAEHWLLVAVQKGDPGAEAMLGNFYLSGLLGQANVESGIHWLQAAADGGDANAAGMLGSLYITGKQGVPVDGQRGVQLARKALAANDVLGHYAIGVAYETGTGIEKNPEQAWYHLAVAERMDNQHQLKSVADYMSKAATQLSPEQLNELRSKVDHDVAAASKGEGHAAG